MIWVVPDIKIGDTIEMLEDYTLQSGLVLERGRTFTVADVGTRYKMPFVYVEELGHELQLQPRTYKLKGASL